MWFIRSYCSLLFTFRQARSIDDGVDLAQVSQYPSTPALLFISVPVNNRHMQVMIDTGAQCSFLNEQCLDLIDQSHFSRINSQSFYLADGLTSFLVTGIVHLNILIGGYVTHIDAFVTKNLCSNLILGLDYLTRYDLTIRPKKKSMIFYFRHQRVALPFDIAPVSITVPVESSRHPSPFSSSFTPSQKASVTSSTSPKTGQISSSSTTSISPDHPPCSNGIPIAGTAYFSSQCSIDGSDVSRTMTNSLSPSISSSHAVVPPSTAPPLDLTISNLIHHITDPIQHASMQSLLSQFTSRFDTSKYSVARTTICHAIETYPHTPPVSRCFSTSPSLTTEMRLIIDNLLDTGLIRPSQSSYAAPALLVKKRPDLAISYRL